MPARQDTPDPSRLGTGFRDAPIDGEATRAELDSLRHLAGLESFFPAQGLDMGEFCGRVREVTARRRREWAKVKRSIETVGLRQLAFYFLPLSVFLWLYLRTPGQFQSITLPLIMALFVGEMVWRVLRRRAMWFEARRVAKGVCHRCGYSLKGLPVKVMVRGSQVIRLGPGTCPECSLVWPAVPPEPPRPLRWGDRRSSY